MAQAKYPVIDSDGNMVYGPDGQPLLTDNPSGSGINKTGVDQLSPTRDVWKGGGRSANWMPPDFTQTYGNYTGLFPSMGQQVGQALYGSIQPNNYLPSWYQSMLPERQNRVVDVGKYFGNSPAMMEKQSFGSRVMNNPYPLNGSILFGQSNVPRVSNASNPFIGGYAGLGGYNPGQTQSGNPGGGTWTTPPPNPLFGTPVPSGQPPPTGNNPGFNPAPLPVPQPPPTRMPVAPAPAPGTPVPIAYPQQPPVTRAPVSDIPTPPINLGPGAPAPPSTQYPRPPSQTPFGQYPAPTPTYGVPRAPNPYAPTTGQLTPVMGPGRTDVAGQQAQPGMDQQTINSILSYFLR